jgi:hypothetical protein
MPLLRLVLLLRVLRLDVIELLALELVLVLGLVGNLPKGYIRNVPLP